MVQYIKKLNIIFYPDIAIKILLDKDQIKTKNTKNKKTPKGEKRSVAMIKL